MTTGTVTDFLAEEPDPTFHAAAADLHQRQQQLVAALYRNPTMTPAVCRDFLWDFTKKWIEQHTHD